MMIFVILLAVQAQLVRGLQPDSLLLGLTQLVQPANVSGTGHGTSCAEQLRSLHSAWLERQSWALKAFDASGAGYDNFMLGNSFWLGNRFSCRAVNEPLLQDFTKRQTQLLRQPAPFSFDYRVVYLRAHSVWQLALSVQAPPLLHIGLCVPRSCDQLQLERLLRQTLAAGSGQLQRLDMHPELVYTKRPAGSVVQLLSSHASRWLLLLLAVSLLLLLAGISGRAASSRFVACFDVAANWRRLWQVAAPGHCQDIAVINGMRVCSALVLLCVHVAWYQLFAINHSAELADKVAKLSMRSYLPIMVEVFFVISGFLTVSNFLGNEALQRSIAADYLCGNVRRLGRQLAQRYLRLAPLQLLVMLLSVVSFSYQREASVFHLIEPVDELCTQHWWRNLLFVQNLYPVKEMCCNWTWSLGCDMQLYIVTMLLLYVHTRYPHLVRRLALMLLLGNVVYTVLLLFVLDVSATLEDVYSVGDWTYTSPWMRSLTYIIGCFYGYAYARNWGAPFNALFPSWLAKCALAGITLCLASQMQDLEQVTPTLLGCALVLMRALLATAIAHLILRSKHSEQSFPIIRWLVNFLESKCFQRLNRFTYAFYLLNPLVILHFYYSFSDAIPADLSVLIILCVAFTVIVFIFSILLTLFFELPFNSLSNLLLAPVVPTNKTN